MRFIDLFAGCGGLSLGLAWSGAQGLFAVERDPMAFNTFRANLLDSPRGRISRFSWPSAWLEKRAWGIEDILKEHSQKLSSFRGMGIELIAGGPPCQGFSFAGKRNPNDPRNQLFKRYIDFVSLIRPTAVLLENVPGMAVPHGVSKFGEARISGEVRGSYFETISRELDKLGYDVQGKIIDASHFGVPQKRARLIVVGLLRDRISGSGAVNRSSLFFERLESGRELFLKSLGLTCPVSADNAIGDLALRKSDGSFGPLKICEDPESPNGFYELAYATRGPESAYQRLMRTDVPEGLEMDSMRLTRHSQIVQSRFSAIIRNCRQGVCMSDQDRALFQLRKYRIHPMSPKDPAPTITTLPDDIVHFRDPRILTVRECARLQSFPDWFVFKGKYTTGGSRRTKECPRYTQVGNAVPPLLAFAVAKALQEVIASNSVDAVSASS